MYPENSVTSLEHLWCSVSTSYSYFEYWFYFCNYSLIWASSSIFAKAHLKRFSFLPYLKGKKNSSSSYSMDKPGKDCTVHTDNFFVYRHVKIILKIYCGKCFFKFFEWVDLAYWWSCIGKGLDARACSLWSRLVFKTNYFCFWPCCPIACSFVNKGVRFNKLSVCLFCAMQIWKDMT